MPTFYCIKYGLLCAGLIMVGIASLCTLIYALSRRGVKHQKEMPENQNA